MSSDAKLGRMSLSQVLKALPAFTFEERQLLIRRVIELDDPPLSEADESLVESRLAAHHRHPSSSVPLKNLRELHRRSSRRTRRPRKKPINSFQTSSAQEHPLALSEEFSVPGNLPSNRARESRYRGGSAARCKTRSGVEASNLTHVGQDLQDFSE